jgi:two-component system sensor histidine kinase RegB
VDSFQQTALLDNLQRLCVIRWIMLGAMAMALASAYAYQVDVPYAALLLVLLLFTGLNIATWLRSLQAWPVTELEFLLQILADIFGLSLLLYLSGGATNPFISYFLVPLSITAATLPWRFTWLVAVLCIGIYSLLLVFHQPLAVFALHNHGAPRFNLHIIGMWANFTFSALLITYFVVRMAQALRSREQLLNQLREEDLRDEQIMAVATLAAGTAHELGTPLSTMKILLEELQQDSIVNTPLSEDLGILARQVEVCRSTLKKLVATADRNRSGLDTHYQAGEYFRELIRDWHLLHPEAKLSLDIDPQLDHLQLSGDATLKQALINLLNNARDASPRGIAVAVTANSAGVTMVILDQGPGLPNDIAEQIGKPIIINSDSGLGIGLLLTHATLNKFGGNVTLYRRAQGGTRTEATLPATRKSPQDA